AVLGAANGIKSSVRNISYDNVYHQPRWSGLVNPAFRPVQAGLPLKLRASLYAFIAEVMLIVRMNSHLRWKISVRWEAVLLERWRKTARA
ncbi:MAG: hypothetical protein M8364_20730, partial [Methylobacter sp.]|uniref:hypothetical protein n=1 Tax=Methylobacter sp. TaxID=2051955 RepID=UPI002584DBE5